MTFINIFSKPEKIDVSTYIFVTFVNNTNDNKKSPAKRIFRSKKLVCIKISLYKVQFNAYLSIQNTYFLEFEDFNFDSAYKQNSCLKNPTSQ